MTDFTNLDGFDLVYAVTEATINSQFALLAAEQILPTSWSAKSDDGLATIDATLGAPVVSFATGANAGALLQLALPLMTGTFAFWEVQPQPTGPPTSVQVTKDIAGSVLVFTSGLNLAELQSTADAAVPAEVKAQLDKFDPSMLSLQQLFIDLEDTNLTTAKLDTSALGTISVQTEGDIQGLISQWVKQVAGSKQPFLLGITAIDRTPPSVDPTWSPTGMTFGLQPNPTAGLSTVDFQLVTGGRTVPAGGPSATAWVSDPAAQGAFAISQQLIMANLVSSVAAAISKPTSIFTAGNGAAVASFGNDIGGTTSVSITPQVGSAAIVVAVDATYRKEVHDKLGLDIGYIGGTIDQSVTLTLDVDSSTGVVSATLVASEQNMTKQEYPNTLGEVEKVLATIADALFSGIAIAFSGGIFEMLSDEDWSQAMVQTTFSPAVEITERIVMPGGGQIIFKDAVFGSDGSLRLTTTVSN